MRFYWGVFLIALLWASVIPFDRAPDESGHYVICEYIYQNGSLPHGGAEEIRIPIWGFLIDLLQS